MRNVPNGSARLFRINDIRQMVARREVAHDTPGILSNPIEFYGFSRRAFREATVREYVTCARGVP